MGRLKRRTVDFFGHDVKHTRTMEIIESRYGNDGYAAWFKLLELLGDSEDHFYDCRSPVNAAFLSSKIRNSDDFRDGFMTLLADIEAIDRDLWVKHKVIWCEHFVERLAQVYSKRQQKLPERPNIRPGNNGRGGISGAENTHSKVKYSKVKYSKGNYLFVGTSNEVRLAEYFFSKILENNPQAKHPNLQVWAKQIDLMLRVDKRTPEDIQAVIDWSQADDFWKVNILSPGKLREQFDRLWLKMTNVKGGRHNGIKEWLAKGEQDGLKEG